MVLRKYQKEDQPALEEIFKMLVPAYFGAGELADFRSYLAEHGGTYFVITMDGKIKAGGGHHLQENWGRLSWYLVHPEMAGSGAGRKLVEHNLGELNRQGVERTEVWTSQLAEGFFSKFGFDVVRRENHYWTDGIHLVLMERMETREP